jgi:transcriptional regulator GlxA family with amidase domain
MIALAAARQEVCWRTMTGATAVADLAVAMIRLAIGDTLIEEVKRPCRRSDS